jgi:putative two-component system response regulator
MAAERILIVDDDEDVLLIVQTILDNAGYTAVLARNGREAVEKAIDGQPDLILLDVMMPGMDGYEVCRRLKRDPRTMGIPVIFLTAKSDVGDEEKGLELGAADYIAKPISPPIVMARLKIHLALKTMADFLRKRNIDAPSFT